MQIHRSQAAVQDVDAIVFGTRKMTQSIDPTSAKSGGSGDNNDYAVLNNLTKWAGTNFKAGKIRAMGVNNSSDVSFRKQRDHIANWNE